MAAVDHAPICGAYSLRPTDRQRLVLGVERALRLGPRPLAELLIEVTDGVPHLLRRLDDLRRLSPEVAEAIGASVRGRRVVPPIEMPVRLREAVR